ncbi:MAG: hypothetical protein KatS3mg015_1547 [Fimbriimonadales bacterium]|nr:MAG: hypothetical protein KatS3mg015_1547 [Fimbriimonadales bacterium]
MMNNDMNMKKQQSHDRESLAFRMRFVALAAFIGVLLAWLAPSPPAQSQGIPPVCAGAGEPGTNPCGTIGLSCATASCSGTPGQTLWYCCYEVRNKYGLPLYCREWWGRYRCCNNRWEPDCHRNNSDDEELNCETTGSQAGQCYG